MGRYLWPNTTDSARTLVLLTAAEGQTFALITTSHDITAPELFLPRQQGIRGNQCMEELNSFLEDVSQELKGLFKTLQSYSA